MDSSCLVLDSLIQESNLLLEKQKQLMLEDVRILNENLTDFLKSITDVAGDRLQSLIKRKYSQLEEVQKKNEAILIKNGIKVSKIKSVIEGSISSIKGQLMGAAKKRDRTLFEKTMTSGAKKIKDFFEKHSNLFGWKNIDPTDYLVPLVITVIIITLKAIILFVSIWLLGPGMFSLSSTASWNAVMQVLLLFAALPIIEEAGKFFAIKTGSGGKYMILFNSADFALTMFALPGALLAKVLLRLIAIIGHIHTYRTQKISTEKEAIDQMNAFTYSVGINEVRTMLEIILTALTKSVSVAAAIT